MARLIKIVAALSALACALVFVNRQITATTVLVPSNEWVTAGDMAAPRAGASGTLLPDGRLLVAGGIGDEGVTSSAEAYVPASNAFAALPPMQEARANHTATLLADGTVLVVGGTGSGGAALSSAEIFDPASNTWHAAGVLTTARRGHTASLLPDGKVLVAGGDDAGAAIGTAEIFDPATGSFSMLEATIGARTLHAAATLLDGRVLIAGGFDGVSPLASTVVFDPETLAFTAGPDLSTPRSGLSATTLLKGTVLLAGGAGPDGELATAEIYDPAANAMAATDNMLGAARQNHLAFLLPHNNQVLIAGGTAAGEAVATAEYFTPWQGANGSFCSGECATGYVGPQLPGVPRVWATGGALSVPASETVRSSEGDGTLLVAGGSGQQSAQVFGFATIKTDKEDYAPGTTVTITGSGWQPGEYVALVLKEFPTLDEHPLLDLQADENGNITSTEFVPDEHDIGIRFYLTAFGTTSQAQTTFRDSKINNVTVNALNGTVVPGGQATYTVMVDFNGNTVSCTALLSVATSLPAGVTASFSAPSLTSTGGIELSTLTLETTGATPLGSTTFTVRADQQAGTCQSGGSGFDTATATLNVVARDITAVSVGAQGATLVYGSAGATTYPISVARSGTSVLDATLTLAGSLPAGVTASFSPSTLHWNSGDGSPKASTLTITTSASSPAGLTGFAVRATNVAVPSNQEEGSGELLIAQKAVTPTVTAVASKVYDGTTAATLSTATLSGVLAGDAANVTLNVGSFTYDDRNVGTGKTVTAAGLTLSGSAAPNYVLTTTSTTTTAAITARPITVTAAPDSREYDGTTSSAGVPVVSVNTIADGDTAAFTQAFDDKNVGTNKTLIPSGTVEDGNGGANYAITFVNNTTGVITARPLTVTASGMSKEYDSTTAATVTLSDDRIAGDLLTASYTTAEFSDKHVGTGKTINVSGISISGPDAGNYSANTTATATADITPRSLTVTATGVDKTYDGNTTATVSLSDDRVSGDDITVGFAAASFVDKHVGTSKEVSVSGISIGGADAGNYALANTTASTTANITPRLLTVGATGVNKVYDATTAATVELSDDRIVGDVLTFSYTASFADKNVGMAKPISVTGIAITGGADQLDYTLASTSASATADITPKALVVTATGVSKGYDGTTNADVTLSVTPLGTDVVTATYTSATFEDKNVGTNKTITVTGIALSGPDAANYTSNTTTTTTADIVPLDAIPHVTVNDKVYDGNTAATIATRTLSGVLGGDDVSLTGGTATFDDKNVGAGKTVSVTGLALAGADAANYTLSTTSVTATASITARMLTVTALGFNKVYDGTADATVTLSDDRVPGDVLTVDYTSALFDDKNVGVAKPITVSGLSISGPDAGNYQLAATTVAASPAHIMPRALVVSAEGVNKVYDGNTDASVTLSDDRVPGDELTLSYASAAFNDKNVGVEKTITVSGITVTGADAGNYNFNTTANTTADITPAPVSPHVTASDKVYDGNVSAVIATRTLTGVIGTDDVSLAGGSATFADKNVGASKPVTATGLGLAGADAGNYVLSSTTATTTASITPKTLTVGATASNKVYDGTVAASVTLNDNRVAGDTLMVTAASATFANKNAGTGKTVTVTGIAMSGPDAGNYVLGNTTTTATANITPAPLTVTATAADKVFDNTTTATVTLADNRIAGDVLTVTYAAANFDTSAVGTGKTVTVTGIAITGPDAGNYSLQNTTATTTANIIGWTTQGFYQPVGMSDTVVVWNTVKGGSTVPLKFNLFAGGVEKTSVSDILSFQQGTVACSAGLEDTVDDVLLTTGGTSLRYSGTPGAGGQFIQNWQTPKGANKCYIVMMTAKDGSVIRAFFKMK